MNVAKCGNNSQISSLNFIVIGAYKNILERNDKQDLLNEYLTYG